MTDLKIIIPMAGVGKRFGELTRRKPKALVRLTDRRLLDHVLNSFRGLESAYTLQYIFVIGYLGEQIMKYAKETYPDKRIAYFVQEELKGQSHAIYLARDAISGPVLLTYCDTINATDFSFLPLGAADGIASVQEVDDPERFGVAVVGPNNLISRLIEKPRTRDYNLALTGLYYFADGKALIQAIETQLQSNASVNKEYYLADAINILIDEGMRIRAVKVSQWLDAGTPEALLEANACLLRDYGGPRNGAELVQSNVLIPPLYIAKSASVQNSIIGPNVSIGENCSVNGSIIQNTIVDNDTTVDQVNLSGSLIGRGCSLRGNPIRSIVGDHFELGANGTRSAPTEGNTV